MELERLRVVFRSALELPGDAPVDNLEYRGIDKWDSLAHMSLVAAIEDEFGVMLDTDEVIDLSAFSRAREILEKHGVVLSD
ncbi:acyl carrier protein [Micromonospora sp. NPDC000089]|uniref:acyl carrier protein n=1 Tax=unclassified Micromonospora TaxID=2617518 RepID=UPI00367DB969